MGEFIPTLMTIIGAVGVIAGAAFYLKFTATKANIDGKDATIATLEKSNEVLKEENANLNKANSELIGENRTLRNIATQTPEIVELTKTVSRSIDQQGKVATNLASLTGEIKKLVRIQENK